MTSFQIMPSSLRKNFCCKHVDSSHFAPSSIAKFRESAYCLRPKVFLQDLKRHTFCTNNSIPFFLYLTNKILTLFLHYCISAEGWEVQLCQKPLVPLRAEGSGSVLSLEFSAEGWEIQLCQKPKFPSLFGLSVSAQTQAPVFPICLLP